MLQLDNIACKQGAVLEPDTEKLKRVIDNESSPIYNAIIFSPCKDDKSGYNLREIVAATDKVPVMKVIHADQPSNRKLNILIE